MYDKIQQLQQLDSSDQEEQPIFIHKNLNILSQNHNENLLSNSIKSAIFNFRYNILHSNYVPISSLQRKPIILQNHSSSAFLLGNTYDFSTMQKFIKRFQQIIWLSYRTNRQGLSDVGWGCMIRVVQMIFAEVLQRCNRQISTTQIIELFKQGSEALFSLKNICTQGDFFERWVSSNEVVSAISSILKNSLKIKTIQQKVNIDLNFQIDIYHGVMDLRGTSNQQLHFPRIVFISSTKFSDQHENQTEKYYPHLKHLMKLNSFCGAAGGTGQSALFVAGFYEQKAIILDPHYAQEENEETLQYFKKTPRGIPLNKMASSFSFCFYFDKAQDYHEWVAELVYIQRIYSPYIIFEVDTDNNDEAEKNRKRSQDFEIL